MLLLGLSADVDVSELEPDVVSRLVPAVEDDMGASGVVCVDVSELLDSLVSVVVVAVVSGGGVVRGGGGRELVVVVVV